MANEVINWTKINMNGWTKYGGSSQTFGPFTIEKEDTRSYSIWWGNVEIGEASSIPEAKRIATEHANSL